MDDWTLTPRNVRALRRITNSTGMLRNPLAASARAVRTGAVRGQWVRARRGAGDGGGVILYLHGGGYFFGSVRSHYGIAKRLSDHAGCPVFLLDYPLAPEHPFPAAQDAAVAAYRMLLEQGFAPEDIALAGDSAGGHLAAALLHDLCRLGLPMPAAAALFSPLVDMTGEPARLRDLRAPDPVLPFALGAEGIAAYLGGASPTHPRVDVLAADKGGWPPILIQVGEIEILRDDADALARSLRDGGRSCELQVWPGQVHVFQALARVLPQGRAALRYSGEFLRARMTSASSAAESSRRRSA